MPYLPLWLTAGFVGWVVRNVFATVGLGIVAYVGVEAALSALSNAIRSELSGAPADMLALMGLGCLDNAISMVLAAYAVNAAMKAFGKIAPISASASS